jgi:hypothetical protein
LEEHDRKMREELEVIAKLLTGLINGKEEKRGKIKT